MYSKSFTVIGSGTPLDKSESVILLIKYVTDYLWYGDTAQYDRQSAYSHCHICCITTYNGDRELTP